MNTAEDLNKLHGIRQELSDFYDDGAFDRLIRNRDNMSEEDFDWALSLRQAVAAQKLAKEVGQKSTF